MGSSASSRTTAPAPASSRARRSRRVGTGQRWPRASTSRSAATPVAAEALIGGLSASEAVMAPRPTWQGHLRLSLVTCHVALYTATSPAGDVHFNMLHKETHNRIRMIPTDPELGPVERSDLVKGYEYDKGHYIVVTPEEIESVRLESTKTLDIGRASCRERGE